MKLDMFRLTPDGYGITIDAKAFRFEGSELEALPWRAAEDGWKTIGYYSTDPTSPADWVCEFTPDQDYTDMTFYDGPASRLFPIKRLEERP